MHTELGNTMVVAIVNDEYVPVEYQLKNNDRVKIITNSLAFGSTKEWLDKTHITKARRKIMKFGYSLDCVGKWILV